MALLDQNLNKFPLVNSRFHNNQSLPRLEIRIIPQFGKAVFTLDNISIGQLVEVSHVIPFTEDEYKIIEPTILYNYVYEWPAVFY